MRGDVVAIATYEDRRLEGTRFFELAEDRICVRATLGESHKSESTYPLVRLLPQFQRVWVRSELFMFGVWQFLVGCVACAVVPEIAELAFPLDHPKRLALGIAVAGFVWSLFTYRRIEYACFLWDSGIFAFDIARAGKQRQEFESFLASITQQIQIARSSLAVKDRDQ